MTHEEAAREILKSYEGDEDYMFLLERIISALASAEKKGREEDKRVDLTDMVDAVKLKNDGWNQAIESCVKVALECEDEYGCGEKIASQLEKLNNLAGGEV